jgi:hypothetical protein
MPLRIVPMFTELVWDSMMRRLTEIKMELEMRKLKEGK